MPKKLFLTVFLSASLFTFSGSQLPIATDHLLVTEVQISGARSSYDFVRIYNPSQNPVPLEGFRLLKRTQTGKEYSLYRFPARSQILPQSYLVWANSKDNFAKLLETPYQSQANLAKNNSLALLNNQQTIIDALAWGKGEKSFQEGSPFPKNPSANQSLKRKQIAGHYLDSNSNEIDFYLADHQLTSYLQPDNLVLGGKTPQRLRPETVLEISLALGVISVVIILFLVKKL